ncbi:hypothetical protein EBU99_06225 [bacterium]|nr:hypothetical protein [bacterium]
MYARILENALLRWECGVEWYLLKVDSLNTRWMNYSNTLSNRQTQILERPDHSRRLLQLTLAGLILAFAVILFSCQTAPRPFMTAPQARRFDAAKPERELDQLYLKRDEFVIKNREAGSSTGSIWADSSEPRTLLADATPNKEGQTINVLIPDELQFDPKSMTSETDAKAKDKDKKTGGKSDTSTAGNNALRLTDPDDASPSQKIAQKPIKTLKMQIVGFEPGGDVYLRGTRRFVGNNGEENTTMVLAKMPRRALTGYEVDARELTDVAVNEDLGGRTREYSAPGWDEIVSRRLAGFNPDLKSEMLALDGLRDEIKTAQASLRDQAKANEMERERIRKERSRMSGQTTTATTPDNNKTSESSAAPADQKSGGK